MRTLSRPGAAALPLILTGLALTGGRPAAAQVTLPSATQPTLVAVRGGIYLPFNSRVKNSVGKTFYGGGLDYAFQYQPGVSRTNVSLDYIERSSGGRTVRIIPLTVSQFTLQNSQNGIRPYAGIGAGAYFIHQDTVNDLGQSETNNKTAFGGFVAVGLDLPSNLLVEARYHVIQKVGSANDSGLQLMAGIRF